MSDKLRALLDEATPGPWRWHGQIGSCHTIRLTTTYDGILTVMEPVRWGMQSAQFVFWRRRKDEHWGFNGEREPAADVAVREVPYRNDIVDIANPNAQLIVAAVNALPALLDVADAARHLSELHAMGAGGDDWWGAHDALAAAVAKLDGQAVEA